MIRCNYKPKRLLKGKPGGVAIEFLFSESIVKDYSLSLEDVEKIVSEAFAEHLVGTNY